MTGHAHQAADKMRSGLNHPVIDGDGHWVEYDPAFAERLRKVGGDVAAEGFLAAMAPTRAALNMTLEERRRPRLAMPGFWTRQTTNTKDRATAIMPRMLYDRLDEFGTDFGIIYPTAGLRFPRIANDEARRAVIRGYNVVTSDMFSKLSDRLTPAAIIPMHHPDEAIEELEFVTKQLGMKVGMFGSAFPRPVEAVAATDPDTTPRSWLCSASTVGTTTIRCGRSASTSGSRRLSTAPAATRGCAIRRPISPTTTSAISPPPRGLFLGGVTRRFPGLRCAFLEGGVGWGAQLFGDLIEHWERRNIKALENLKPEKLDRDLLMNLVKKYGYDDIAEQLSARRVANPDMHATGGLEELDDFAKCEIAQKSDWLDLYAKPYYFGCEADDPSIAFGDTNKFHAKLNALYSSDIGQFDVIDMREPLQEAFELVEDGIVNREDFEVFTFSDVVRFIGALNPNFSDGTRVAGEARSVLAQNGHRSGGGVTG